MKIIANAPERVRWETVKGKVLGKGAASLAAPPDTQTLLAVDPVTGGRTVVEVKGGKADFAALAAGRLVVRAQPYADVKLGSKDLGTTPFDAVSLPPGSYRVVLSYEGKVVEREISVTSGKEAVVAVNMLK